MIFDAPACLQATTCDEALLPRSLDQHGVGVSDPGGEQRPLDAVRQRRDQSCQFGGDTVGHLVQHGIPRQVHVLGETTPQGAGLFERGVAVAAGVGIGAPVGGLAMPVLADAAPLAVVAADVVLDEDAIAFDDAVQPLELLTRHRDGADVLVTHDHRAVERRLPCTSSRRSRRYPRPRPSAEPCRRTTRASGSSRNSVVLGAVRTAARTLSTICHLLGLVEAWL